MTGSRESLITKDGEEHIPAGWHRPSPATHHRSAGISALTTLQAGRLVSCLLSSPKDEEFPEIFGNTVQRAERDPQVIREIADSYCCLAGLNIKRDVRRRGFRQSME